MERNSGKIKLLKGLRLYVPFFICFAISATLWFVREMGKTYDEQLTLSVSYENIPKSLVLVSQMPNEIQVMVESSGWGILNHYLFGTKHLKIDVGQLKKSNISRINTKDNRILSVLGEQLKVMETYPTEIGFVFENIHSRKVPVKLDITLSYEQQYELSDMVVTPDSVTVYGAAEIIDTIEMVYAEPFSKKKVRRSFEKELTVQPIPNVRFSDEKIRVKADVEKFTEQTFLIPIKLVNVPQNGIAVDLMEDKVSIKFLVGISNVQSCYPSDFEAIADFEKRNEKGAIPIEIVRYPQCVRIVQQTPLTDNIIADYIEESNE